MHDVHAGSMADLSCSIAQITIIVIYDYYSKELHYICTKITI